MTEGKARIRYGTGNFTIEDQANCDKSGSLTYTRNYDDEEISVTGEYDGEVIDL